MKSFAAVFFALLSTVAIADENAHESAHASEEGHRKHNLGLFVGVTREHGENLDTLGIEYSYRFHEKWSVGGVIERADREKDSTLIIAFVHHFIYKGLFVGAGLGRKDPGDERQNTARGTIGYDFELPGGWIIVPQANVDFIHNESNEEVYGIAFGKQF